MPDPYRDSSEDIRDRVYGIVALRQSQEDLATRIQERDAEYHTGGSAFIVRMERIMKYTESITHAVQAQVITGKKVKKRVRSKSRRS